MRKILFWLLILVMIFILPCLSWAKDKEVTLTWSQMLPTPNDLKGWNVYASETKGGPYRLLGFIPYVNTSEKYSWTLDKLHNLNLKKKANMYFVISSVDNEGNVSGYSGETSVQVDDAPSGDVTAPAVPGDVNASKK